MCITFLADKTKLKSKQNEGNTYTLSLAIVH